MSATRTKQSEELLTNLFAVGRILRSRTSRNTSSPLSTLQLETLCYVAEHEKPLMKDVAKYLAITPPSATSLVECLVTRGKLRRVTDTKDRRSVRIAITPKGKRAVTAILSEKRGRMEELFSAVSEQEQKRIITILKKVLASYESQ